MEAYEKADVSAATGCDVYGNSHYLAANTNTGIRIMVHFWNAAGTDPAYRNMPKRVIAAFADFVKAVETGEKESAA